MDKPTAKIILSKIRNRSQSSGLRQNLLYIEQMIDTIPDPDPEAAQALAAWHTAVVRFIGEFDAWQRRGDGIADSEGHFNDVVLARNAIENPSLEKATTKYVCTYCGSSDVFEDAYAGMNGQGTLTYDQKFCSRCGGECSVEEVPIDTPEPVGETIQGRHL